MYHIANTEHTVHNMVIYQEEYYFGFDNDYLFDKGVGAVYCSILPEEQHSTGQHIGF
jgi:hypothetical protein